MSLDDTILADIEAGIFAVTSDLDDYAPGSTAVLTAWNVEEGGTVAFQVEHLDAGADAGQRSATI